MEPAKKAMSEKSNVSLCIFAIWFSFKIIKIGLNYWKGGFEITN